MSEATPPPPFRFQMRRIRGWRMPQPARSCTRPHPWSNPDKIGELGQLVLPGGALDPVPRILSRQDVVNNFRNRIEADPEMQARARRELRGLNLGCACGPHEPCHVDVLLEIANAPTPGPEANP